ncbi:MAG: UDP-N-acetylglucosamine--N-acetylmuramyl-(pentapeptide) pyrophosphoryl-undecaprenol N-acetylglucosamine transferase [Candidatus Peribacteraceae bacterium]
MTSPKTVLFCGGGSVGHVAPFLAVGQALTKHSPDIRTVFICTERSEETWLLTHARVRFSTLPPLRVPSMYSPRALLFPLSFLRTFLRSLVILRQEHPDAVFSTGGTVSTPVCLAAWCRRIPVVLHESDSVLSRGGSFLARISRKICTGFVIDRLTSRMRQKVVHTGNPVRGEILRGNRSAGQRITRFSGRRPVLLVIGGSQGAQSINEAVEQMFEELLDLTDIIHLTGAGKAISRTHARYFARPFVTEELPHLYALADLAVTRAGAGVLAELAVLRKPAIVVPLTGVAHDHQQKNAEHLAAQGAVELLEQERLLELPERVASLLRDSERRQRLGGNLARAFPSGAAERIARILLDVL